MKTNFDNLRPSRRLWGLRAPAGDPEALDTRVYAEQVALLYNQGPLAYIVTFIAGAVLAFVQQSYIGSSVLVSWFAALVVVTGLRILFTLRYANRVSRTASLSRWLAIYLLGVGLAGLVWGASAILLFPPDSLPHQVFVAFILAGMSAGGVTVLAARMEACLLFLVLSLVPLGFQWFRLEGELQAAMGIMTAIFFFGLLLSAWNMHSAISSALYLRFDNRALQQEIEQRRVAEEDLYREKERLQITLAAIDDGVVITDADARIVYSNPAALRLTGERGDGFAQQPIGDIFPVVDEHTREPFAPAAEQCIECKSQVTQNGSLLNDAGEECFVELVASPLYGRYGTSVGSVCVFRDVTDSRRRTAQLVYAAQHDALTGLPNRNLFHDRLTQAVARAQRTQLQFAVLFVDLDRFKQVNDEFGHGAGDILLRQTATRLIASVRHEDTVARLGGDEFVVIVERLENAKIAQTIADKILDSLARPFMLIDRYVTISASIGVSVFSDSEMDAETLLRNADQATYRAKTAGRNQACSYESLT